MDHRAVRMITNGVVDRTVENWVADEHSRSTVKNRLFTGPRGGRISTAVLRDATHWDDVVTKLGYERLRRHDLRYTGLTWFADAGVQVHVLGRIAGRGSLTTTQRYLYPDVHKITAAGAALSAHLSVLRAPRSLPSPIVMTR
ncbi:hypothetical protein ACFU8Q_01535 [Streptomyces sp. NPDC057543]|uniref:hypothetical protein n=1 Tax=Streptomyces sp. NPDC057543 TaxID=3346163 RepID=UPI0036808496